MDLRLYSLIAELAKPVNGGQSETQSFDNSPLRVALQAMPYPTRRMLSLAIQQVDIYETCRAKTEDLSRELKSSQTFEARRITDKTLKDGSAAKKNAEKVFGTASNKVKMIICESNIGSGIQGVKRQLHALEMADKALATQVANWIDRLPIHEAMNSYCNKVSMEQQTDDGIPTIVDKPEHDTSLSSLGRYHGDREKHSRNESLDTELSDRTNSRKRRRVPDETGMPNITAHSAQLYDTRTAEPYDSRSIDPHENFPPLQRNYFQSSSLEHMQTIQTMQNTPNTRNMPHQNTPSMPQQHILYPREPQQAQTLEYQYGAPFEFSTPGWQIEPYPENTGIFRQS